MKVNKDKLVYIIITFSILITCFCLVFFLRYPYNFKIASDACFVSGVLGLALLGFQLVIRLGIFDIPGYAFHQLFSSFKKNNVREYEDAYDYSSKKKEKRSKHKIFVWPLICLSCTFIALAILFAVLYSYIPYSGV